MSTVGTGLAGAFTTSTGVGLSLVGGGESGGASGAAAVVALGEVLTSIEPTIPTKVAVRVFNSGGIFVPLYASKQIVDTQITANPASVLVMIVITVRLVGISFMKHNQ